MRVLNIPDTQLGIIRYDERRRWRRCVYDHAFDAFEAMVELAIMRGAELVTQAGDLLQNVSLDDEGWQRLLRVLERGRRQGLRFLLLGGNHDSVKSYERVGTLDALAELPYVDVVNRFKPEVVEVHRALRVGCIPHMRSQQEFLKACAAWDKDVDLLLMHCSLGVTERFGPNDMQLPFELLERLRAHAPYVFIGHEHQFNEVVEGRVFQTGSTMPFSFSEVGQKYALLLETGAHGSHVMKLPILPIVHFAEVHAQFSSVEELVILLNGRIAYENHILRYCIGGVPAHEYPAVRAMTEAVATSSEMPVLFKLTRVGELSIEEITNESVSFNLLEELGEYCAKLGVKEADASALHTYLNDALAVIGEEDLL